MAKTCAPFIMAPTEGANIRATTKRKATPGLILVWCAWCVWEGREGGRGGGEEGEEGYLVRFRRFGLVGTNPKVSFFYV